MKKTLVLLLSALLALSVFTACGGGSAAPAADTSTPAAQSEQFQTIGDVMDYEENRQFACYDGLFVYVFEKDGVFYRVRAKLDEASQKALDEADVMDEDYDEQVKAAVSGLSIDVQENLSEQIPSQAELDAMAGKTGQELLEEGYVINGYDLESMKFWMDKGPFSYEVYFDYEGEPMENTEDFDEAEAVAPLSVKSVTFDNLSSDATTVE